MRFSLTLVISEGIFGLFYDRQEDFEVSFEFYFILVSKFLLLRSFCHLVAGHNGLVEFSIGEFFEVSITTKKHIINYGSYVSKEGINIVFDKCDISRMITAAAITADGESSRWILSLEDFLTFMSIPNFRDLN